MSEPTEQNGVLIHTENLSKTYPDGHVNAIVNMNLTIHQGEYLAIMGPSGTGKSTLLNLLGALDRPTSGEIFFEGEPLSKLKDLDALRSRKIGFVFQSFYLLPTLTAIENVQIPMFEGSLSPTQRTNRAAELLEAVGMSHRAKHLSSQLSVGERQRVAIARSLANEPRLLMADEPTGNLDSQSALDILALFDRLHQERGMTLITVTHSEEVGHRANRIIRLRDGKIVADQKVVAANS